MKYLITLSVLISFWQTELFAQNSVLGLVKDPVERGNQLFYDFSYASAIESYKKALGKSNIPDDSIELKIAESYRMLNDPESAAAWYKKVLGENDEVEVKYMLHYAEALSSQKKYAEAKIWYEKYDYNTFDDSRGTKKLNVLNNQEQLYRNESSVSIQKADFNSKGSDFSPVILEEGILFVSSRESKNALSELFNWDKSNYLDLFIYSEGKTKRMERGLNSKFHEGPAVLYDNGKKMIFTRNDYLKGKVNTSDDGITNLKLFYSEKKEDNEWSQPVELPFNNSQYSVGHPAISSDGSTLYFASDMPGGLGGVDLYKSVWSGSAWQEPTNLGPEINTEGNELFPTIVDDTDLYFASNGHGGLGGLDIFVVDISKASKQINNIGSPINGPLDDFGFAMESSGNSGYFSTNREGSGNKDDIYHFTVTRPLVTSYIVKGKVYDSRSEAPVSGALVHLTDDKGKIVKSIQSDSMGNYSMAVDPNMSYKLNTEVSDYLESQKTLVTTQSETKNVWNIDLPLTKDYGFSLRGLVTDNKSGEGIDGVNVTMVDNLTNKEVLQSESSDEGVFDYIIQQYEINDRISYQIKLEKDGYLSKSLVYNALLEEPGVLDVNANLDLGLDKLEIGADIGKLIDIQPIYFDVGKYAIRPDAAEELNKIVSIMQDNPSIEIELGSHTDSRGSAKSNLSLSDKRAKASAEYIISQGISQERIEGKGFGEAQLINRCADGVPCSAEEHQLNRRTEFKITKY